MVKTAKKTAVAVKSASTEVATSKLMSKMIKNSGRGNENLTAKDLLVPWLKIVQALSNICKKTHEDYMEEAEAGMIFNTASKQLWGATDGVIIIPVSYTRHYIEWTEPNGNGNFVCDHGTNENILLECEKDEKGKHITSNGNVIYETGMHYVFLVDPVTGDFEQAVISMDRTQLKASKKLNDMIVKKKLVDEDTGETSPASRGDFAFRLTTKTKTQGDDQWEVWNVQDYGIITTLPNGEEIWDSVESFRESVASGKVKAAEHQEEEVSNNGSM